MRLRNEPLPDQSIFREGNPKQTPGFAVFGKISDCSGNNATANNDLIYSSQALKTHLKYGKGFF
jgi:hypothetical protein